MKPRYLPPDTSFDSLAAGIDKAAAEYAMALAMAGIALVRVQEWITRGRGGARQRGLRSDLVALCICPHLLPCKRPSASWCAREHGVSRQMASRLQKEFVLELGDYIRFRGQRFQLKKLGRLSCQVPRRSSSAS